MKISFFTIASLIYAILLGSTEGNSNECTYVFFYKPVCGNDGVTYINSGHLTCQKLKQPGLRQLREGECPEGGEVIGDGPLGDRGDHDSKPKKIKIKIKKGHKNKGHVINHAIKAIASNLKRHKSGNKSGRRGRRSAEENNDYNENYEEYPEYIYEDENSNEAVSNERVNPPSVSYEIM